MRTPRMMNRALIALTLSLFTLGSLGSVSAKAPTKQSKKAVKSKAKKKKRSKVADQKSRSDVKKGELVLFNKRHVKNTMTQLKLKLENSKSQMAKMKVEMLAVKTEHQVLKKEMSEKTTTLRAAVSNTAAMTPTPKL